MKLTIEKSALSAGLSAVAAAVATRTTKPVLQCVKCTAEDGWLKLLAYDTEESIVYRAALSDCTRAGSALIPHRRLSELIREAGDGEVSIAADADSTLIRTSPKGRFNLPAYPLNEYPDPPETGDVPPTLTVPSGELRRAVRRVSFSAVANKEVGDSRFAFKSVLFDVAAGQLHLVATDSSRMAAAEVANVSAAGETTGTFLLPPHALSSLGGVLMDDSEPVKVTLRPAYAKFAVGPAEVGTRLVEGRYPPWRLYLKDRPKHGVDLPVPAFAAAVRQARVLLDDFARLELSLSAGRCAVGVAKGGMGSGESEFELPGYDGPELEVPVAAENLADFCRVLVADGQQAVRFAFTSRVKPLLFTAAGWRYMVMPQTAGETEEAAA